MKYIAESCSLALSGPPYLIRKRNYKHSSRSGILIDPEIHDIVARTHMI